jgi:hypothetical protein
MKNVLNFLKLCLFSIALTNCGGVKYRPPIAEVCIIGNSDMQCTDLRISNRTYHEAFAPNRLVINPNEWNAVYDWCFEIIKNLRLCNRGYNSLPPSEYPPITLCVSSMETVACFAGDTSTNLPYSNYLNWISVNATDYNTIRNWCDTKAEELQTCRLKRSYRPN